MLCRETLRLVRNCQELSGVLFQSLCTEHQTIAEFTAKFMDVAVTNRLANRRLLMKPMKLSMGPGQARSSLVEGVQRASLPLQLYVGHSRYPNPVVAQALQFLNHHPFLSCIGWVRVKLLHCYIFTLFGRIKIKPVGI